MTFSGVPTTMCVVCEYARRGIPQKGLYGNKYFFFSYIYKYTYLYFYITYIYIFINLYTFYSFHPPVVPKAWSYHINCCVYTPFNWVNKISQITYYIMKFSNDSRILRVLNMNTHYRYYYLLYWSIQKTEWHWPKNNHIHR